MVVVSDIAGGPLLRGIPMLAAWMLASHAGAMGELRMFGLCLGRRQQVPVGGS
jgi:hypothetical protein